MRRYLLTFGTLLFLGAVALPVLIYYTGSKIVGPYEGSGRIMEFTGSIYVDALQGQPTAWLLLLAPAALLAVWRIFSWVRRRSLATPGSAGYSRTK